MIRMSFGMDFLISTGTFAAYFYSLISTITSMVHPSERDAENYFDTAAVLIAVVIIGNLLV